MDSITKKVVVAENAPAALGPYSAGIIAGNFVFASGQIPADPKTGKFPEGIDAQTRQALTNVKAILEAAGTGLDKVVKTTVFLSDMNNFAAMNNVYKEFFTSNFPARSAVQVARLPKDALIEIEVIAIK